MTPHQVADTLLGMPTPTCLAVPANRVEWAIYMIGAVAQITAIVMVRLGGETSWRPNRWFRPDTAVGRIAMIAVLYLLVPVVTGLLVGMLGPDGC